MKYIDADKLKTRLRNSIKMLQEGEPTNEITRIIGERYIETYNKLLSFIDSLQQEQPLTTEKVVEQCKKFGGNPEVIQQKRPEKSKKDCNSCPHCIDRKDQNGWHFKGCFGGPYKGKFIAEIEECPLQQEQPEANLEKAAEKYAQDETMSGLAERAFKAGAGWERKELTPLINRLCEAILFEWKDAVELARKIQAQIREE